MGKNTSVALGDHFEDFVSSKIKSGRFSNASEIIRAGLRLLESEEAKIEALNKALEDGENSGFVVDFDRHDLLKELHEKHASS